MLRTIVHGLLALGGCVALVAGSVPPGGPGGTPARSLCPASPQPHHMTCLGASLALAPLLPSPSPSPEQTGTASSLGASRG